MRPPLTLGSEQQACSFLRRRATRVWLASRLRLGSISICATSLVACTELSPLHQNTDANPHNSVVATANYKLTFIEFGEQGSYQDTSQLKNAIQLVQNTNKPLVITYVHGWQNNSGSGDVERFSGLLSRLNRAPAIRDAGFNVVGVYIGWRGNLTAVPVLKELSFWNRKATAERIASNFDCYDAIAAISDAARRSHGPLNQYTILLGHSFGGLIVERSVAHAINAEMYAHADPERSLPADLILVVNPASDSILARQMISALYSRPGTEKSRPMFVSITSTGDTATSLAFPIGTGLAATTKGFNQVPSPGPAKQMHSEREFYTSTPGHNQMLINYVTEKLPKTISSHGLPAFETNLRHNLTGEVFTQDGPNDTLELWHIKRVSEVDVPYWDVSVDPSIIKNHGDLWNERAEAMMAAIFRIANPRLNPYAKPRATLQKPPDFRRLQYRQH
jgi:pimeloyl-ACP methyl ester carboxylesterase